uniref:Uncharacterized protein n=1 Tax=Trichogramma kaykai TaxID=54128 RepID=A0ABD2W8D5_9HYME
MSEQCLLRVISHTDSRKRGKKVNESHSLAVTFDPMLRANRASLLPGLLPPPATTTTTTTTTASIIIHGRGG